jgi:predicted ATPase
MIDRLLIKGFKRFNDTPLKMRALTVLTGVNGAGKTSVIHALLLMREATQKRAVMLSGPFDLQLGTAEDVVNWNSAGTIEFEVEEEGTSYHWKLQPPADEARYLVASTTPNPLPFAFQSIPRGFTYLSAERLGPRGSVVASARPAEELEIGVRGEYSAQIIETAGNKPGLPERRHPSSDEASLLKYEIERWLGELTRPLAVEALHHAAADAYALQFQVPTGGQWIRAPNMGFGVSYALPVVVAGLTAATGGMLIVENPEAHLHPAGQSRMGVFLAWLASKRIQVVVETHSDHVLNGIRRAIGEHAFIRPEDAVVQFFDGSDDPVQELDFTESGGISHWPKGFFDQYQIDVAALGRIRRSTKIDDIRR